MAIERTTNTKISTVAIFNTPVCIYAGIASKLFIHPQNGKISRLNIIITIIIENLTLFNYFSTIYNLCQYRIQLTKAVNNNFMNQYVINYKNSDSANAISSSLSRLYKTPYPVIVCVGSDLVIGDSLGPYVGTEISKKLNNVYVYGTLASPITAKETNAIYNNVKKIHPKSPILVIDAAIGDSDDVGLIKITDRGIKPGLGVNKDLELIGDVSIIGIVADKKNSIASLYHQTRFSLVYGLSQAIIKGIINYFNC